MQEMRGIKPGTPVQNMTDEQLDWLMSELTRNGEPAEGDTRFPRLVEVRKEIAKRHGVFMLGEEGIFHHPV